MLNLLVVKLVRDMMRYVPTICEFVVAYLLTYFDSKTLF